MILTFLFCFMARVLQISAISKSQILLPRINHFSHLAEVSDFSFMIFEAVHFPLCPEQSPGCATQMRSHIMMVPSSCCSAATVLWVEAHLDLIRPYGFSHIGLARLFHSNFMRPNVYFCPLTLLHSSNHRI